MNNKLSLLFLRPKRSFSYLLLLLISILLFVVSYLLFTYDTFNTIGNVICDDECYVSVILPYNKIDIFDKTNIVYLNDVEYKIHDYNIESSMIEYDTPLQKVSIRTDDVTDNDIVDVKFKYNKQRIILKILDLIKKG